MALGTHKLKMETLVPGSMETVFDFFSNAENLERITPPELGFKILNPLPIEMEQGTLIDYRIRLFLCPDYLRAPNTLAVLLTIYH